MTDEEVYAAVLRPRRRPFRWFVVIVCAIVTVLLADIARMTYVEACRYNHLTGVARSCLDNGNAYAAGECMPVVVKYPYKAADPNPFDDSYKVPPL